MGAEASCGGGGCCGDPKMKEAQIHVFLLNIKLRIQ